jgi:nitrous oxide reductase accessory protein NosL
MGGAEAVPFGDEASAKTFVGQHGGRIVPFGDAKKAMAKEGQQ